MTSNKTCRFRLLSRLVGWIYPPQRHHTSNNIRWINPPYPLTQPNPPSAIAVGLFFLLLLFVTASQAAPDLVISNVSTSATSANIGTSITVSNTETNQGDVAATSHSIKFYLSTDNQIDSSDLALGVRNLSTLAIGASSTAGTKLTIPKTTPPGDYYLGAVADSASTQLENDETNNTLVSANRITIIRDVDLVISELSPSVSSIGIGSSLTLANTETNQGSTVTSNSHTLRFYLSTDEQIDSSDTLLAGRSISTLNAGASSAANTNITIPKTTPPGAYFLGAIADANNTQPESDETNNSRTTPITVVRDVDLILTEVATSTPSVPAGGSLLIANTELNQGTTLNSHSNVIRFYLSTDSNLTTSDRLLSGNRTITTIAPNTPNSAITKVTVPKTTPLGTYTLGGCADSTNSQIESNETNNCTVNSSLLTITQNQPPSISLSSDKTTAAAPASVTLSAQASDSDGSISKVDFYNGTTLLGSSTAAPYSYTWNNIAAGNYSLSAKATDDIGAVTSSNTVNLTVTVHQAQAYYIHPDHLGTPRIISDQNQNVVWRWDNVDPFGDNTANEDPDSDGVAFEFNLRFPGQYFDKETGLAYNYYRDYNPSTGRYVQSDPIGLGGGVNTYGYVSGNPLAAVDPLGLFGWSDMPAVPQSVVDFSAGMGDTISMGTTNWIRDQMATNGSVNTCSSAYGYGENTGIGVGLAGGALGIAKGASKWMERKSAEKLAKLRQAYVDETASLQDLALGARAAGADVEAVARILHAERNALKVKYRELSPADKVRQFEQRNVEKYGNPIGPSIEHLRNAGKSWENIIESSTRSGGKDLGL